MPAKKISKFIRSNIIIVIIIVAILFVGLSSLYKIFASKTVYVYVKVKVGQGNWWAATQRPSIWIVNAINKGDVASDILGRPSARLLSKRYYRYFTSDQFDIYTTLVLRAGFNRKTGEYSFDRAALSVGSPIAIQFPKAELTGVVIALSDKPFEDKNVQKTITLTKKYAYPWEYGTIKIGDSYFDGQDNIFEIVDKQSGQGTGLLSLGNYSSGNGSAILEPANYITVKARVKIRKVNGQWIFGEDQIVSPGRAFSISTENYVFDNYVVTQID